MADWYQGGCLCGAVEFEARTFLADAAHCHCSMCRKFHGAEYATFVSVPLDAFRWVRGQESAQEYEAQNGTVRTFCKHCGSSLLFASPKAEPDIVEVALAAFSPEAPVTPNAHIFVGSAASWTHITDDLPQYEEGRESKRLK